MTTVIEAKGKYTNHEERVMKMALRQAPGNTQHGHDTTVG